MITELITVGLAGIVLGVVVMFFLMKSKKFRNSIDRSDIKKQEAINNPELLLEKLKSNGKMIDDGDEIVYSIEEEGGKKKLVQSVKEAAVPKGTPKIPEVIEPQEELKPEDYKTEEEFEKEIESQRIEEEVEEKINKPEENNN